MTDSKQDGLYCTGLKKTFQQGNESLAILDGIDLTVKQGDSVAILGSSGSGKTTLLQCLAGLDNPTSGEIIVDGVNINKLSESARCQLRNEKMGFIFQLHHLLHDFSALEHVTMPLLIRSKVQSKACKTAIELLERVGLGHRLDHRPAQLSGGERQRVAVARALITQPRFLMADEPTGNLDQELAENIHNLLFDLQKTMNFGMLIVTHNVEFSTRMQRVLHLKSGKLEA